MLLLASAATDGSVGPVTASGTTAYVKVLPLVCVSAIPCLPPQLPCGTYMVPSGETRMWPWMESHGVVTPKRCVGVLQTRPPFVLLEHSAPATTSTFCAQ